MKYQKYQQLSEEVKKSLVGQRILRVSEQAIHLSSGKAIYLSDNEIESLNVDIPVNKDIFRNHYV